MPNTQRSLVGIAIATVIGLGVLTAVISDDSARADSHAQETARVAEADSTSTVLVSPVTSTSTTVTQSSQTKREVSRVSRHISEATTTTSEVPPSLTAEQEEIIPDSDQETFERGDAFDPMDYDLPSEIEP